MMRLPVPVGNAGLSTGWYRRIGDRDEWMQHQRRCARNHCLRSKRRNYRHLHRRERRDPHYRRARPCNAGLRPSPEGGRSGGRRLWRRRRRPPRSGRLANSGPAMTKAGSRQAAVPLCFHLDLAAFLPPGWRATRRAVGWGSPGRHERPSSFNRWGSWCVDYALALSG